MITKLYLMKNLQTKVKLLQWYLQENKKVKKVF
jgi:hypothetical protein